MALVLAALIVSYASSLKAWSEQRDEIASLEAELAERQQNVEQYEQDIERWQDPSYVEARARERFGWVQPGEVGYIVVDGGVVEGGEQVAGQSGGSAEQNAERTKPPWWDTLWASVDRAGNPPKPKPADQGSAPKTPEPADTIGPDGGDDSAPDDTDDTDEPDEPDEPDERDE